MNSSEITDSMRRAMHRPGLRTPDPKCPQCHGKGMVDSGQFVLRCRTCFPDSSNAAPARPAVPSPATDSTEPAGPGAEPVGREAEAPEHCLFTIPGAPIGKPRMTQRDKWKKRPCVIRYREWADRARLSAPDDMTKDPTDVNWTAYLAMPKSWGVKKRAAMTGQLHREKPDADNICKALFDALFKSDCGIATGSFRKCWDDGNGPRLIVAVL